MLERMARSLPPTPASIPTPQTPYERLDLARTLFREFQPTCFWHSPRDLEITEDRIPFVVRGLRANGGRRGFILAGKLQPSPPPRRR